VSTDCLCFVGGFVREPLRSEKHGLEDRLRSAASKAAELQSLCQNLQRERDQNKEDLDSLRKEFASLRYKYESFEIERKSLEEKERKTRAQNERLQRELTKKEADAKAEKATFQSIVLSKNEELSRARAEAAALEQHNEATQQRLREEFDAKLGEFVAKREDQYKLEKEEWMRIFKDEFNRKLAAYKGANDDLAADNKQKEGELKDLRSRLSKSRARWTELEAVCRGAEEEAESLRNALDAVRRAKDEELKESKQQLLAVVDRMKAKELEFDELASIKMQLDAEIELYRSILNEAEAECGYMSPLDARNRAGDRSRNSRKRRRFNNMTPMASLRESESAETAPSAAVSATVSAMVNTPGKERAAKIAMDDLRALDSPRSADEELKEEEDDEFDVDDAATLTPGNVEGAPLLFSGLDLNCGMIEIQNTGETAIPLDGYCLSNADGTAQYALPTDTELESKGRVRVYVGTKLYSMMKDGTLDTEQLVGPKYRGSFVFWGRDVWTGTDADCARLYDPDNVEVATMEITPEMVDHKKAKHNGCRIM